MTIEPQHYSSLLFIEAWNVLGLGDVISSRLHLFDRMDKLIFDVCAHESELVAGRMAILIWTIWNNRNNLI
jgi:hypothetical protein